MNDKQNQATESELVVLKSLWQEGAGTVRELETRLKRSGHAWAYTTLQTLLARLEAKQLVAVDRMGFAHIYSAAVTRDEFLGQRLTSLADQVCDGTATPLVMALVENTKFSKDDIAHFRKLLDQLDAEQKTSQRNTAKRKKGKP